VTFEALRHLGRHTFTVVVEQGVVAWIRLVALQVKPE
jgi:hypothetical protein